MRSADSSCRVVSGIPCYRPATTARPGQVVAEHASPRRRRRGTQHLRQLTARPHPYRRRRRDHAFASRAVSGPQPAPENRLLTLRPSAPEVPPCLLPLPTTWPSSTGPPRSLTSSAVPSGGSRSRRGGDGFRSPGSAAATASPPSTSRRSSGSSRNGRPPRPMPAPCRPPGRRTDRPGPPVAVEPRLNARPPRRWRAGAGPQTTTPEGARHGIRREARRLLASPLQDRARQVPHPRRR